MIQKLLRQFQPDYLLVDIASIDQTVICKLKMSDAEAIRHNHWHQQRNTHYRYFRQGQFHG